MKHITVLLLPNMMASSISLPLEMLNAANGIKQSQTKNIKPIEIALASTEEGHTLTSGGFSIQPNAKLSDITTTDLVIIPALWRNPQSSHFNRNAVCEWLKKIEANSDAIICAVGTGSSLLAEANILHEKAATTHWFYFDLMEKKYPKVRWKRKHLITQSGQIYCAGSVNSIADLTIHFIELTFSTSIAQRVQSQFSPEIRQAYDSHLFDENKLTRHNDELVAHIQSDIREHFNESINFSEMANNSQIAYRTLLRRFKLSIGQTPLQYQQYLRTQNGRDLLKNTNLNIQEISELCGYVDASHFSRIFKQLIGQTPNQYRKTIRGKLFNS